MGSGRGSSRRVNSMTAVARELEVGEMDPVAWDLFVAERKLLRMDIGDYYGLRRVAHPNFSPQEQIKLVQEVLEDLSILGAFRWPDEVELNRFEVLIGDYHLPSGPPLHGMIIRDRQTGFDALVHTFPHPHILSEPEMGSWPVRDLVVGVLEAMKTLCKDCL